MLTAEQCRQKAEEAEALARLVSLNTDKARLAAMAADWRKRAAELEDRGGGAAKDDAPKPGEGDVEER